MGEEIKSLAVPRPELSAGDLSDEAWREYRYQNGDTIRIDNPKTLYTRKGGTTHRVVDADGLVHCVFFTPGVELVWKPRTTAAPVAF